MRFIYFLLFTSLSISSFASTTKGWFDAPLDDCFEAIEKGKFLSRFNTKVKLVVPWGWDDWTSDLPNKDGKAKKYCGVISTNYFYDDREYSLSRVRLSYDAGDRTYLCPKLNAENYAFCEYVKHKNVKDVRPIRDRHWDGKKWTY